jgi:hypothetical protein
MIQLADIYFLIIEKREKKPPKAPKFTPEYWPKKKNIPDDYY